MVRPALLESLNPVHQDLRVVTDSIVVGRHTKACQVNAAPSCHPAPYMTMMFWPMLWPRGKMSRVGSIQALQTSCSRSQGVVWCRQVDGSSLPRNGMASAPLPLPPAKQLSHSSRFRRSSSKTCDFPSCTPRSSETRVSRMLSWWRIFRATGHLSMG